MIGTTPWKLLRKRLPKFSPALNNFKEEASFYTWLYRIVVNLAIDRQRQKGRQPLLEREESEDGEDDLVETMPAETATDPYEKVKDKELRERIWTAIDELTPSHKAVILLREVEGLSYEEISEILQCSRGTVMSRLHYARKRLQSRLRDAV